MTEQKNLQDHLKCFLFSLYKKDIPDAFLPYIPCPAATDRSAWKKVPTEFHDYFIQEGEKALSFLKKESSWPVLTAIDYMEFTRTGNRTNFEDKYFKRRNMLTILVLAECFEYSGRFINAIIAGLFLICEESAWQIPAHNTTVRDTTPSILPDIEQPVVDLFAGETGALLTLSYFLLKTKIDKVSCLIGKRIKHELSVRIINPYLHCHFWWMGNGDETMCNWTTWCTQNVLLITFGGEQSVSVRKSVLKKAFYSLDCFLKDYEEDGCCSEGVEYYRHAGLCLFNAADIINNVTGGILDSVFTVPKIKNIAEYIMNMHIDGSPYYMNFSDCSPVAGRSGVREYLFGKKVQSSALCSFAAEEWENSSLAEKNFNCSVESRHGVSLYYILETLFTASEITAAAKFNFLKPDIKNINKWYPSVGVFVVKKNLLTLAVKAGCNGDSHNHNDTGSFILYIEGKPFIIDIGVENYTKKTFSPERYSIWTMQSAWHNLPTIDGYMQSDGKEYASSDVCIESNSISMDISGTYPSKAGIKSYVRTICWSDNNRIILHDCLHSFSTLLESNSVVLSLIVCEKPEIIKESNSTTIQVGQTGCIDLPVTEEKNKISVESVLIKDSRLRKTWPENIYRISIIFSHKITISFMGNKL